MENKINYDGLSEEEKKASWKNAVNSKFEAAANKLLEDVNSGKAVFLPTETELNGAKENQLIKIKPTLVRKAIDGRAITGINQIIAQQKINDMGLKPEGKNFDILTFDQAKNVGAFIVKNKDGKLPEKIDLMMMKDASNPAYYTVYSAAAVKNPQTLPELPTRRSYKLQEFKTENGKIDEYLGKYLAATSQGAQFVTTPKHVAEFKTNFQNELSQQIEKNNFKSIVDLGFNANKVAKQSLGKLYDRGISKDKNVDIEKPLEKKKEQKREAGMSMSMY